MIFIMDTIVNFFFSGYIYIHNDFTLLLLLPTCPFFFNLIIKAMYSLYNYSFKYRFFVIFEEEGT